MSFTPTDYRPIFISRLSYELAVLKLDVGVVILSNAEAAFTSKDGIIS